MISQFFFENEIGNFVGEIVNTPYWILLLLVAVLPAITEEITIRGVVLSGYDNKNIYVACAASGLLFGIMHLDPQQFLYATVLGFILALVVRITNSIFASALIHFIINGTSITMQKIVSLLPMESNDTSLQALSISEKISYSITYAIIALVFSAFAYLIIKKLKDNNSKRGIVMDNKVRKSEDNERIFDIPFIFIIVVYLLVMIKQITMT